MQMIILGIDVTLKRANSNLHYFIASIDKIIRVLH